MTITKRLIKGSQLTHAELDGNFTDLESRVGWLLIQDVATTATPIVVTGGAGATLLTNDGAGADTTNTYAPSGVTDIWNESTNSFDWSQLSVGDMVELSIHMEVNILTTNTEFFIDLHLDTGGTHKHHFITNTNFKNTGVIHLSRYDNIQIRTTGFLNNGGQFKMTADKTCNVTINNFVANVTKLS